jgi:hypothetical protein
MEKKEFKVFVITNKADNNKCYVGMTTQNVSKRIRKIKSSNKNTKITQVLNKFKEDCFEILVPFVVYCEGQALELVNKLIVDYDSINTGYNTTNFKYHTSTKSSSANEILTCKVPKGTTKLIDTLANMCGTSRNSIICTWIEEKLKAHGDML